MDVFENTLINLRVLQSVQCHNRLDTTQTLFQIHTALNFFPIWAKRWWAAQSRSTDISRIQSVYTEAVQLIESEHPQSKRLFEYLDGSRRGLENLKTTYTNDPTIVARIDVILDSVNHILEQVVP